MSRIEHPYGTVDTTYGLHLATIDPALDGPIWMLNLMRYRAVAAYGDDQSTDVSGRQADDRYAPVAILTEIGAEVALFGDVTAQQPEQPAWDRVGVVRYPTRRSFIDMQSRRDFRDRHQHKAAGMEFTIVMGCLPTGVPGQFTVEGTIIGDERRWASVQVTRVADAVTVHVDPAGGDHVALSVTVAATIDAMSAPA